MAEESKAKLNARSRPSVVGAALATFLLTSVVFIFSGTFHETAEGLIPLLLMAPAIYVVLRSELEDGWKLAFVLALAAMVFAFRMWLQHRY